MPNNKKTTAALEGTFQRIHREYVKIKRCHRLNNNQIFYTVLDNILKRMKKTDKLFASLRPRLEYMGSYFEGLRVGLPTEYDINIVLKLPINYDSIELDARGVPDGSTTLILPSEFRRLLFLPHTIEKGYQTMESWCDREHRLNIYKFKSWMQGVLDAALNDLPVENGKKVLQIKKRKFLISAATSQKSPANTICIVAKYNTHFIDVDLVPTLGLRLPKLPRGSRVLFDKVALTSEPLYFVVPKPVNEEEDSAWRLSFPLQEKYLMKNMHYMKSALKLLKLLRDTQNFSALASYFIKTLFLREAENQPEDFWRTNSLTFLTFHMLGRLQESLIKMEITSYWCPGHNLLDSVKAETIQQLSHRLEKILRDFDTNAIRSPDLLLSYFTKSQTA